MSLGDRVNAATDQLEQLASQAGLIAGPEGTMSTGAFMVYELIDSEGDYNLGYLHSQNLPRWRFVGMLQWALDRMTAMSPGETEIEFDEDED